MSNVLLVGYFDNKGIKNKHLLFLRLIYIFMIHNKLTS
jgi:hypothetical protein